MTLVYDSLRFTVDVYLLLKVSRAWIAKSSVPRSIPLVKGYFTTQTAIVQACQIWALACQHE